MLTVFWHPDVLLHDTGEGVFEAPASSLISASELHPESAPRILNMKSILERGPLASALEWAPVPLHGEEELELVHTAAYLDELHHSAAAGGRRFTATTVLGGGSWPALLAAASAAMEAGRAALERPGVPAYALIRPPGHHAQPECADGYCFLNNAGLAAETALRGRGATGRDYRLRCSPRKRDAGVLLEPAGRADDLAAHGPWCLGCDSPTDRRCV